MASNIASQEVSSGLNVWSAAVSGESSQSSTSEQNMDLENNSHNSSSYGGDNSSSSSDGAPNIIRKHVYNSQIFNYDMIVDLVDEVYEEVWGSECQRILLRNKLRDLQVRHRRALKKGRRAIAYSLKIQMATVEGVKCMYDEYNARKRAKLERLQSYSL